jgi:hypothetical protein
VANNAKKYGFRFVGYGGISSDQPRIIRMPIVSGLQPSASATNVDLRAGDPVKQLSTGGIDLAAAGDTVFGVILGFTTVWDGQKMAFRNKWPGGTSYGTTLTPAERRTYALIVLAHDAWFEVDADDNTTATTEAAYLALVGENCDHAVPADTTDSGNPKADPMLDISTHATTSTLGWRILGISTAVENKDFSGTQVKLIVTCNKVSTAPAGTATGT